MFLFASKPGLIFYAKSVHKTEKLKCEDVLKGCRNQLTYQNSEFIRSHGRAEYLFGTVVDLGGDSEERRNFILCHYLLISSHFHSGGDVLLDILWLHQKSGCITIVTLPTTSLFLCFITDL